MNVLYTQNSKILTVDPGLDASRPRLEFLLLLCRPPLWWCILELLVLKLSSTSSSSYSLSRRPSLSSLISSFSLISSSDAPSLVLEFLSLLLLAVVLRFSPNLLPLCLSLLWWTWAASVRRLSFTSSSLSPSKYLTSLWNMKYKIYCQLYVLYV